MKTSGHNHCRGYAAADLPPVVLVMYAYCIGLPEPNIQSSASLAALPRAHHTPQPRPSSCTQPDALHSFVQNKQLQEADLFNPWEGYPILNVDDPQPIRIPATHHIVRCLLSRSSCRSPAKPVPHPTRPRQGFPEPLRWPLGSRRCTVSLVWYLLPPPFLGGGGWMNFLLSLSLRFSTEHSSVPGLGILNYISGPVRSGPSRDLAFPNQG